MMQGTVNFFTAAWKVYKIDCPGSSCVFKRDVMVEISYIRINKNVAVEVVAQSSCSKVSRTLNSLRMPLHRWNVPPSLLHNAFKTTRESHLLEL
jgi:hypothetical protein